MQLEACTSDCPGAGHECTDGTECAKEPHHTDEWTISRFEYLWFDSDSVSGPAPHQSEGVVPEAENSFFDLDEAGIGRLDEMVRKAREFAKLEDRPSVVSLRIARKIQMVPERAYGAVEWQIVLSSGRENATVHLDVAGDVTGADLSGTLRAQRFDMFTQDDWPAKEVQTQLAAEIGDGAVVHDSHAAGMPEMEVESVALADATAWVRVRLGHSAHLLRFDAAEALDAPS